MTTKESPRMSRPVRSKLGLRATILIMLVLCSGVATANAGAAPVVPAPRWEAQVAALMNFKVGSFESTGNFYEFGLTNIGGAPAVGPVEVEVALPPGVTAEYVASSSGPWETTFLHTCSILSAGTLVSCNVPEVKPFQGFFEIGVNVSGSAPTALETHLVVKGGGAPELQRTFVNEVNSARPPFGISLFQSEATGPAGESSVVAAGHPTLLNTVMSSPATIVLNTWEPPIFTSGPRRGAIRNDKDIVVDLPAGMVGNPTAARKCPIQVFLTQPLAGVSSCPPGSQVGSFAISGEGTTFAGNEGAAVSLVGERNPIFNLEPEPGYPAELGFFDTGLSHGIVAPATLAHTSQGYVVRVIASELVTGVFGPHFLQASFFGNPQRASGIPGANRPFLTNPADCSGLPLRTELHLDTWADPASVPLKDDGTRDFGAANFSDPQWYSAASDAPPVSGCESLQFNPTVRFKPNESSADSPTGLDVKVSVPQSEEPEGQATPPLRDATVALPRGLVVNPSSADGLAGCTEAQLAPDSTDPGSCPDASKVGTATLETPLIDHRLEGSVYLGTPECSPCGNSDAAEGRLLKLYIEINDPSTGIVVKLPGKVSADPASGQLTATFKENPQLPFENLELHFRSGQRATLTTPSLCGEYTTTTDLMPWSAPQSGPDATPQSRFQITSGPGGGACAAGESGMSNSPQFEAGAVTPLAGTYSPFVLKLGRENGSQRIGSIDATLPAGLLGRIAGVPYCPDAAIAAAGSKGGREEQANPSCPLASQVGTVTVGAGSGNPYYVQGHVYLAGPYKGAPLSLEIITPAVAGPFDLGTVAVRAALYVNETTAQIHAVSDPIPSILAGIPLDVRSIALNMSKPEFTLNPTSCNAMNVLGSMTSTLGQVASLRNRFQVGGCKGLDFSPALKLAFSGQTKRTGNPAVKAVLTQPKGQNANVAGATVILPKGMFIDQAHVNSPCTRVQFNSGALPGEGCPAKSVLGTAKAWTPLLEKPEEGKVYFRSNGGERELPDLVVALRGQVPLQLVGFIDSVGKKGAEVRRVRSRFLNLPDAPVSRFELKLAGGKKGLLENSKNLCKGKDLAKFQLVGQNGKTHDTEPKVQVACGRSSKKTKAG